MVKRDFSNVCLPERLAIRETSIKNFDSAKGKNFLHFQKHFCLRNWIWQRKVFFDFQFSHFPCKVKILNKHGSSSNDQKMWFLEDFAIWNLWQKLYTQLFPCKIFVRMFISNSKLVKYFHFLIFLNVLQNGGENQISCFLAVCHKYIHERAHITPTPSHWASFTPHKH